MVDEDPEKYLGQLQEMLLNKTYNTSEYVTFIKHDSGKDREIFKLPYFPDRICQWAILQVIEPYLVKNFIKNTIQQSLEGEFILHFMILTRLFSMMFLEHSIA